MLQKEVIQRQLEETEKALLDFKYNYIQLCEGDRLSKQGELLQKTINQLKGEIKAYNWVLNKFA